MKEHVTLTQKEQTRLQILNSLMADHMTTEQAATLMGVSARHTRRILAAYRREGEAVCLGVVPERTKLGGHGQVNVLAVTGHPGVEGRRCGRLVLLLHAVVLLPSLLCSACSRPFHAEH